MTAKTLRWPASVASVSTCQRRRKSPIVSFRKCTNASPSHLTGPRPNRRFSHDTSRAARSPIFRARWALQKPTTSPAMTAPNTAAPISAIVSSSGFVAALHRQQSQRDRGKAEDDQLVPDACERHRERHRTAAEPPAAQHREGDGHAGRGAARSDVGRRRRGLRDDERLAEAEAGKRRLPGWRVREDVDEGDDREREQLVPRQRLDDVPDVAVVGDARQDEEERHARSRRARGRRRSAAASASGRATPLSGSPAAACRSPSSRTLPPYDLRHGAVFANGDARARGDVRDRPRVVRHRRRRGGGDPARRARRLRRGGADRALRRDGRPRRPPGSRRLRRCSETTRGPSTRSTRGCRTESTPRARPSTRRSTTSARSRRACRSIGSSASRPRARTRAGRSGSAIRTTWRGGRRLSPGGSGG